MRIIKPDQRKLLWFLSDKKYINRQYRIGAFDEGYDTSCNTVTVSLDWCLSRILVETYLFIRSASCTLRIIFKKHFFLYFSTKHDITKMENYWFIGYNALLQNFVIKSNFLNLVLDMTRMRNLIVRHWQTNKNLTLIICWGN